LADYQIKVGQLTNTSGVWPEEYALQPFVKFCQGAYAVTTDLIEGAK